MAFHSCGAALASGSVDLVTTSLLLPDADGMALARAVREDGGQRYVPIIVVSGDVQSRLENRSFSEDVTDYFDKALGHSALAAFIRGYVQPEPVPGARVLYVEDSRVVAVATKRILERHGMVVRHFTDVEGALEHLHECHTKDDIGVDLVLAWIQRRLTPRALRSPSRGAPSSPSSVVGGPDLDAPSSAAHS